MPPSSRLPAKSFCCPCQSAERESANVEGPRQKKQFVPSRRRSNLILVAAMLTARLICAQTQVATAPVGFTTVIIPASEMRALSLPLTNFPVFSGIVSALSGSMIQTLNANWSNSFGPFELNPHVIRFRSGANTGGQFKILSNTQDTLTLQAGDNEIAATLSAGDRYDILPVATLQSLFGSNAPALTHNMDSSLADNVLLRGAFGWLVYYNNGSQWLRQGAGYASQNNVAILPERGFLLVRRGHMQLAFTVTGPVPRTNLRTQLPAGQLTTFANRFPADLRLSDLKLDQLPEWVANSTALAADSVLIFENSDWRTYYHNGVDWLNGDIGLVPQNPIIALGTSVLVVRQPGTDVSLHQAPPY